MFCKVLIITLFCTNQSVFYDVDENDGESVRGRETQKMVCDMFWCSYCQRIRDKQVDPSIFERNFSLQWLQLKY